MPTFFKYYCLLLLAGIASLIVIAISGDPRVYHKGDITVGGVQGRYYYYILMFLPLFVDHGLENYLVLWKQQFRMKIRTLNVACSIC